MYNFVLQVLIMLSLGTLVYIMARAVPRVGERVNVSSPIKYLDRLIKNIPLEKIDGFLSLTAEKSLRKLKIWILKLDNIISNHLNKFKVVEKKPLNQGILENVSSQALPAENKSSALQENKSLDQKNKE